MPAWDFQHPLFQTNTGPKKLDMDMHMDTNTGMSINTNLNTNTNMKKSIYKVHEHVKKADYLMVAKFKF
jgi:hypothetical protein